MFIYFKELFSDWQIMVAGLKFFLTDGQHTDKDSKDSDSDSEVSVCFLLVTMHLIYLACIVCVYF